MTLTSIESFILLNDIVYEDPYSRRMRPEDEGVDKLIPN